MRTYAIVRPTNQLENSIKYAAKAYEQNLRHNIMFHAYKRLQYICRYILNSRINVEASTEEKNELKKRNSKIIYHTLQHMFAVTPQLLSQQLIEQLHDGQFATDTEDDDTDYEEEFESDDEMDIDDDDEEMDIDDNNDEEIDINDNISVELIDFVKSNLQS